MFIWNCSVLNEKVKIMGLNRWRVLAKWPITGEGEGVRHHLRPHRPAHHQQVVGGVSERGGGLPPVLELQDAAEPVPESFPPESVCHIKTLVSSPG